MNIYVIANTVKIELHDGTVIGYIRQELFFVFFRCCCSRFCFFLIYFYILSYSICRSIYNFLDSEKKQVLTIKGPCCIYCISDNHDAKFTVSLVIYDNNNNNNNKKTKNNFCFKAKKDSTQIGLISKQASNVLKENFTIEDDFGVMCNYIYTRLCYL